MAFITVSASVLEHVAGWAITEGDEDKLLKISWDYEGKVRVHDANNIEGGYFNDYQVNRETFLNEDLPALKLSNEIEEEDYTL